MLPPRDDQGIPPAHDWRTTDRDEIERRRLRARESRFRVVNEDPRHPIHSTFLVHSGTDRRYRVEIRNAARPEAYCECVDFQVNGLGTCKHVEGVWLMLSRRAKTQLRAARLGGTQRIDIVPDRDEGTLRIAEGGPTPWPRALQRLFAGDGRLRHGTDPETAATELLRLSEGSCPEVRVSLEVQPWLERRRRLAERLELRQRYELKVQSGEWPAQETRVPLFPYQREGMLHLAFTERALLADEMGLGKTSKPSPPARSFGAWDVFGGCWW